MSSEFVYSISEEQACDNSDHQSVAFRISDGTDNFTIFDLSSLNATRVSDKCIVTGKFEDIGTEIDAYCLLVPKTTPWPEHVQLNTSIGASLIFSRALKFDSGGDCA